MIPKEIESIIELNEEQRQERYLFTSEQVKDSDSGYYDESEDYFISSLFTHKNVGYFSDETIDLVDDLVKFQGVNAILDCIGTTTRKIITFVFNGGIFATCLD